MKMCICSVCGEDAPHHSGGVCRKCYMARYRANYCTTKQAYNKQYYIDHREEVIADQKRRDIERRYGPNGDAMREYQKLYMRDRRIDHPDAPTFCFLGKDMVLKHHDRPPAGYVHHHMVYDHADPEANIVLLSQSSHAMIHRLLETLNIQIPHINTEQPI